MRSRRLSARTKIEHGERDATLCPPPPAPAAPAAPWAVVAASVRGTAHVRAGTPCQDAHAFTMLADGTLLAAVADGLGSVALAEIGARRAAEAAVAAVRAAIGGPPVRRSRVAKQPLAIADVVRQAFATSRRALEAEARVRCVPLSALATTLLVVTVAPGGMAAVGQVGDGVIVTGGPDGILRRPIPPVDAGIANVVTPLTHPDALRSVRVVTTSGVDTVVLSTDGLELFVTENGPAGEGMPYRPFLDPVLRFAGAGEGTALASTQLAEWLSSDRVTGGTDDDCTLLIATGPAARTRLASVAGS